MDYGIFVPTGNSLQTAVIQVTAGPGQPITIYVLQGDQTTPLFETPTGDSQLFATLDPTGEIVAYINTTPTRRNNPRSPALGAESVTNAIG